MDEGTLLTTVADLETSYGWNEDADELVRRMLASPALATADALTRARVDLLSAIGLIGRGTPDDAARVIRRVRDWAAARGHHVVQARAEMRFSILFRRVGDPALSLEHAVAANDLPAARVDPSTRCELLLCLADALDEAGDDAAATPRYHAAITIARALGVPRLTWRVLNNWAYAELLAGRVDHAAALVAEMEELAVAASEKLPLVAVDTVAEVRHATGRSDEAVSMLRAALASRSPHTPLDTVAQTLLTLAGFERERGDLVPARASVEQAEAIATAHGLRGLAVAAMEERAALLAAEGDHAQAYALHRAFHAESLEVMALKRDARARTLHAVLEMDEARRESARYREMSYRDALTGLLNRRFVDEDLDRRLLVGGPGTVVAVRDAPLCAALVDLDHFKRVNDTCSHEVGDEVLRALAVVLQRHAGAVPDAYAARLGGEEFLLVLPATSLADGVAVAERLRAELAARDWRVLTGEVPVTASVGVAAAPVDALTRAGLLREADRRLYVAKAGGRDRVEPAPSAVRPTREDAGAA